MLSYSLRPLYPPILHSPSSPFAFTHTPISPSPPARFALPRPFSSVLVREFISFALLFDWFTLPYHVYLDSATGRRPHNSLFVLLLNRVQAEAKETRPSVLEPRASSTPSCSLFPVVLSSRFGWHRVDKGAQDCRIYVSTNENDASELHLHRKQRSPPDFNAQQRSLSLPFLHLRTHYQHHLSLFHFLQPKHRVLLQNLPQRRRGVSFHETSEMKSKRPLVRRRPSFLTRRGRRNSSELPSHVSPG